MKYNHILIVLTFYHGNGTFTVLALSYFYFRITIKNSVLE